jgi:hypothetical protein
MLQTTTNGSSDQVIPEDPQPSKSNRDMLRAQARSHRGFNNHSNKQQSKGQAARRQKGTQQQPGGGQACNSK